MLHLDVHGCRDPPHHGAHLLVGMGAMLERCNTPQLVAELDEFGEAVKKVAREVIAGLALQPKAEPVLIVIPDDLEDPPTLSGMWPQSSSRLTQTQQSCTY